MKVIPARPTLYKGIRMRSRLEADYASHLDRQALPWEYEPTCFGGPDGQWLPDFRVFTNTKSGLDFEEFLELKPLGWIEGDWDVNGKIDPLLRRMTVVWDSRPEAALRLVFWEYEAKEPLLEIFSLARGNPWMVVEPKSRYPFPHIWSGMGQWAALNDQG